MKRGEQCKIIGRSMPSQSVSTLGQAQRQNGWMSIIEYTVMHWVWLMAWVLLLVREGSAGGIISNYSYMETILAACNSAPVWKLNMCNLTCATCMTANPNECASCDSNYLYDSTTNACYTTNTYNTFLYADLLSTPLFSNADIQKFQRGMTGSPLLSSDVVDICSANSYAFQMLGLFASTEEINLQVSFTETMQEFTLKFNLLLMVNESKLTVTFKSDDGVLKKVNNYEVADATATYAPSSTETENNFLSIPSLNINTARTFIQVVSITVHAYASDISISFSCVSPNAKGNDGHWAISDVIILATQCNTCVTTAVSAIISSVGNLTLYVLAGTLVFLALLFCLMRITRWQKESTAMAMTNSGKDYLPVKPIDRIISTIDRKGKQEDPIRRTFIKRSRKDILKTQ